MISQLQPQLNASVTTQAASAQSPSSQYQVAQRSSAGPSTAAVGHDQRQQQNRFFRNNERRATAYQAASSRISGPQHPLRTREERLANQRLYEERRRQWQAGAAGDKSKRCYYCGFEGHLSFECPLKKEDQSAASQLPAPAPPARATPGQQPSGNEEGA
ncbi:hypothetical protein PHYSODRAFT_293043 [Phytophthora sojae]|uniref:CCHC-type domain-containing protein n=1 Tax=Phytophthora sojae (strain P6497) TaxID=1094619 RepID=G4YEP2_PHYSP|nr:hypothetical protein PHYSODRAFT_293043 [Phytophthora sojae]EGZ26886.1 hypothetical protein PHYSODRAFT_293043 [Phytophthora sojae]|eukprot:XP_009514161.1 hypothetical protein PHYSODRAFT_293043 [Phytophthora sojae]